MNEVVLLVIIRSVTLFMGLAAITWTVHWYRQTSTIYEQKAGTQREYVSRLAGMDRDRRNELIRTYGSIKQAPQDQRDLRKRDTTEPLEEAKGELQQMKREFLSKFVWSGILPIILAVFINLLAWL